MVDPFFSLVPRAVWPERPDPLPIAFTTTVEPDYPEGGTRGFSFAAEGYLNWGLAGAVAWSALPDVAARLAAGRRGPECGERRRLLTVVAVLLVDVGVWFYIRDDFAGIVRRSVIAVVLAVACLFILSAARLGTAYPAARSVP